VSEKNQYQFCDYLPVCDEPPSCGAFPVPTTLLDLTDLVAQLANSSDALRLPVTGEVPPPAIPNESSSIFSFFSFSSALPLPGEVHPLAIPGDPSAFSVMGSVDVLIRTSLISD
jgi:hypothetical protein